MTTINHEYYVSLEVAELLKKAGFNWYNCRYRYNDVLKLSCNIPGRTYGGDYHCITPTIEVAQRWLREVKGMDVIIYVFGGSPDKTYTYEANTWSILKNGVVADKEYIGDSYTTYEQALEAGIKKVLELILEKGE